MDTFSIPLGLRHEKGATVLGIERFVLMSNSYRIVCIVYMHVFIVIKVKFIYSR